MRRVGRGKALRRAALRAFNGAVLGMLMGGLLGAALGAVFAAFVIHAWPVGAAFGVPPGLVAGALIGATMVVRHAGWGLAAGTLTGGGAVDVSFSDVVGSLI